MPSYSDLIVRPLVTIATDLTYISVEDNTGEYPDKPGGFAPSGSGTAERPALNEVHTWFFLRQVPFTNPANVIIPLTQDGIFPITGRTPGVYQVVELVVSNVLDYADLLDQGYGFADFMSLANSGALGQTYVITDFDAINMVNDARRRLNNAWSGGRCDCTEYALRKALLQAAYSCCDIASGDAVQAASALSYWLGAQAILDQLNSNQICICNA
jgi:hypothetical protein